jgi:spore coat polysaccharide biosynthesis protein SpsF
VLKRVVEASGSETYDIVSTVFPRTFPLGFNAELVRTATLLEIERAELDADDAEHVTRFYYRHPERFCILNVASGDASLADLNLAVDTIEDLRRLEILSDAELSEIRCRLAGAAHR